MADLSTELENINTAYYDAEEADIDGLIEELQALHKQALQQSAEAADQFREEAAQVAGGIYIPYLFWPELAKFRKEGENQDSLRELLRAFTESGYEEDTQMKLKPLVVVYYANERQFELDKLESQIVSKAHPEVRDWFRRMREFVTTNAAGTRAYHEKFDLLKDYFPNFELFDQPLQELQEKLSQAE